MPTKKPETRFYEKIKTPLKQLKNTYFCRVQQLSLNGTPDTFLCISGQFVALELKKDAKSKPTELQKYNLVKIREAGGLGLVVHPDNWKKVLFYLEKMADTGLTTREMETLHAENPL